jgi:hypothetical protein
MKSLFKSLIIYSLINIIYLQIINGTQGPLTPLPALAYPPSRKDRLPDLRLPVLRLPQRLWHLPLKLLLVRKRIMRVN